MAAMDIPRVLEFLHPGIHWGDASGSAYTYEEFKEEWPDTNPAIPTKADMLTKWGEIEAADALLPSKADAKARVDAHIGNSIPKMRAIVALLLEEKLSVDPEFLKRNGIDI